MKKISDWYEHYQIMPSLQSHMYRVASVASLICDHLPEVNKRRVVSACLLHDMANIIKFRLDQFPEFFEPLGVAHWKKVQDSFVEKYGEEHKGTYMIAQEIGVSEGTLALIDAVGFRKACENADGVDFEKKICAYSDMRVNPRGVLSLRGRITDLLGRSTRWVNSNDESKKTAEKYTDCLVDIEHQLFAKMKLSPMTPEDINDISIEAIMKTLPDFVLE